MAISLTISKPGIAVLQVNRPQVRNALDWQAIHAFSQCIEDANAAPELRALIVTGSQDIFIAGGDLKKLHNYPSRADGIRLSQEMTNALNRLEGLPYPTIAAINGPARGGGAEISLACDMRIMAENADLGWVQITLGLTPGWGAGQRLLRLVGYSRAFEWLATGKIISAQEALAHGLANHLAPPGQALLAALELADQIASRSEETVRSIKHILQAGLRLPPAAASAFEQAQFPDLWASDTHRQAVEQFLALKKKTKGQ